MICNACNICFQFKTKYLRLTNQHYFIIYIMKYGASKFALCISFFFIILELNQHTIFTMVVPKCNCTCCTYHMF
ncbi:hypothetical protein RhiirC2_320234 [Rhizophagus irregularis]|uniref:Uncharacterized protein n=1 Tax=Rhizophagus irregularis TaxID=588596 RepID=A0A2N1NJ48_9GLOM|nr:hypothetical protein RhiirC2_320234 [Rhizophagus irregularis]